MHRLWHSIVKPVLEATRPNVIVEIGAADGRNTAHILEYCQREGGVCHVIDPLPSFDVSAWETKYGGASVFHECKSLDVLGSIRAIDVVLIDGDHNWYTVFNELKLIDEQARSDGHNFPVVVLHDVGWPYGRRDLYYDPSAIPAAYRQPFKRAGMQPGKADLVERGGLNDSLYNAVTEGGERNGVLTAVEDLISASDFPLDFVMVPGIHGLGLLYSKAVSRQNSQLRDLLKTFGSAEFLFQQCQLIEKRRVKEVMRARELRRALRRMAKRVEALENRAAPDEPERPRAKPRPDGNKPAVQPGQRNGM